MPSHIDDDILVTKLSLDCSNPRHPQQSTQRDIIRWMTEGTGRIGDKLLALARDIASYGLNPAERVMVVADSMKPGEYTVIEGNRRVAAVKLLNNPSLAPTIQWAERFKKIQKGAAVSAKSLRCTIFESPDEAYHFIELKHLGESGGAGVVPWDTEQQARHSLRARKHARHQKAVALIDFIKAKSSDKEIKAFAESGFPITTLDRLLSDRDFRDFLGLCLDANGELAFRIAPAEALKAINKVVRDFGSGHRNVRHVINKKQRTEYMDSISPADRADHTQILPAPIAVTPDANLAANAGAPRSTSLKNPYLNPSRRRTVVIPGTVIPIDAKRFNRHRRVFEELRRVHLRDRIGGTDFPNAAILLLRLFYEMSIDAYIKTKRLAHSSPTGWKDISLTERVRAVLQDLVGSARLEKSVEKVITKALAEKNKAANPNSLNDHAHNPDQIVNPTDIADIWDTYVKFFTAVWDALR